MSEKHWGSAAGMCKVTRSKRYEADSFWSCTAKGAMSLNPHNQENCSRLLGTLGFPKPESSRQGQRSNSPVFSTMGRRCGTCWGINSRAVGFLSKHSTPSLTLFSVLYFNWTTFHSIRPSEHPGSQSEESCIYRESLKKPETEQQRVD